jgi:YggT family protein
MGVAASLTLPLGGDFVPGPLEDAITSVETFVNVFIILYGLVLFAYILMSWIRLPYSLTLDRIQHFVHDVAEPYLRLFRRLLPMTGPLDLSPILAFISLTVIDRLVIWILEHLH